MIEGGHLTYDVDVLRTAARDMLIQVLSCRVGMSQSGVVARVAGQAIDADRFLPSMADDDFLKTLSKGGIEKTIRELGLAPRNTGKEMRAALLQHVGQSRYVLPAALFKLQAAELTELQKQIAADQAPDRGEHGAEHEGPDEDEVEVENGSGRDPEDSLDGADEVDLHEAA